MDTASSLRPMIVVEVGAFGHESYGLISQPILETTKVNIRPAPDRGAIYYVEGYIRPIFFDIEDSMRVFLNRDIETSVEELFGGRRC